MDLLFLAVLNMSITGAFVVMAICLVRLLLRKVPKIISYCLWAVAGLRLLFPFSIESMWSLIPFRGTPISAETGGALTIPGGAVEAGYAAEHVLAAIPGGTASVVLPEVGVAVDFVQILTTVGAFVWVVGAVLMLFYGVLSYLRLRRNMRSAVWVYGNVYEAAQIKTPFVLGIFAPKIYLPPGLSAEERRYIILHEETHIRRGDHIVKCAAYFLLCLHWFNPFVWIAFLLMGADMEMSCDEHVLQALGDQTKADYSRTLVTLATRRPALAYSPLAFGAGRVKGRVKNILRFQKTSRIVSMIAVTLVLVLSLGLMLDRAEGVSGEAYADSATEEAPEPLAEAEEIASFTLQQIEEALKPQLDFAGERLIDWELISAERIGINPPGTTVPPEPAGPHFDVSGAVRYRVTVRWAEEANCPEAGYVWDHAAMDRQAEQFFLENPDIAGGVIVGEGGPLDIFWMRNPKLGTTEVRYWDFFVVEGRPELAFVVC